MNFLDLVRKRQSERGYTGESVSKEAIGRCLEAARLAPSACNSQPWHFVVVDSPEQCSILAPHLHDMIMKGNRFVETAPVLVAIVEERPSISAGIGSLLKGKQYAFLDIGMAAEHFCLQAAEDGLGTCILGWFDEPGVRKVLKIPRSKRIPLVIALGVPSGAQTREKVRKPLNLVSSFGSYKKG